VREGERRREESASERESMRERLLVLVGYTHGCSSSSSEPSREKMLRESERKTVHMGRLRWFCLQRPQSFTTSLPLPPTTSMERKRESC